MIRYFITGLPRSRTAWLANFFTVGDAYCAHDALVGCASLNDFGASICALPGRVIGVSDSAAAFFAPALVLRYPLAKWVIIRRDPEAVVRGLLRMQAYRDFRPLTEKEAWSAVEMGQKALAQIPGLKVEFDDLDDLSTLGHLWEYCLGSAVPWSEARAKQLITTRVEVMPEKIDVRADAMAALWRSVS